MKRQNKFPYIGQNQYLSKILDHILSHTIYFKILPAIGATTLEIEDKTKDSIVIEINVPVIQGKCKKYNTSRLIKVFGVYEGKTVYYIIINVLRQFKLVS